MNFTLSGLKIYNSSAGSGKTYSLIKEYLLILFYSENIYIFKNILVLTFNNQVVKEIKFNILNHLYQLSQGIKYELLIFISKKLNYSDYNIQLKAKKILNIIIHNYQFFSIYTIDKFYYKILYHSNLQYRLYEQIKIEFNINNILEKSIKRLLNNLNKSELYSKTFIKFILYELSIGNTWNPYNFLMHLSSQLIKEKKIFYIEILKIYSINELIKFNNLLNNQLIKIHQKIKLQSLLFFQELKKRNIIFQSFYRLLLPIFFDKLSNKNLLTNINNIFNQKLDNIIFTNQIYSKNIDVVQKQILDIYITKIRNIYSIAKKYLYQYILYSLIKKNILSIITLFKLNKILNEIKFEEKILFNIDIYKIINAQIKNYKITNIYENLGTRYHYYFIDEFQDTSTIQWQNIYPLIENTLAEHGKVLLAGDIKQSIYRWRGSNIEQFFNFIYNKNQEINNSSINYRSYKEIVNFNNLFYSSINHSFNNKKYLNLYKIQQTHFHENNGYVELNLLKSKKNYIDTVYNIIKNKIFQLLEQGYQAMDIAILVRKNEEGSILADLFNYDGITVVNSDYLLLKNFWQIKCIISILRILADPTNIRLRINWLLNMKKINKIQCTNDKFHNLLSKSALVSIEVFFQKLANYGINFNIHFYFTTSIITLIKNIIIAIKLDEKTSIIIIQFFLDFILNNIEEYGNSISKFLEIWDLKKDKESIILSESINAIKIMTIHKAKGLEFPIVFLPFLYWKIFQEKDLEIWNNLYSNHFKNIKIQLKYQKFFNLIKKEYNKTIDEIYIDNLNLLYVSTTRAIEQLIIFTINTKQNNNIGFYLKDFLIQQKLYFDNKIQYTFGISQYKKNHLNRIEQNHNFAIYYNNNDYDPLPDIYSSTQKYNYTKLSDDIQYQSLILIQTISSINITLKKIYYKFYFQTPNLFESLKKKIFSIIYNIDLEIFYTDKYKIQLQSKILFQDKIIQINRLIFTKTKTVIIDYVTNGSYEIHIKKVQDSIKALLNMGYKNIEAFIIYVNKTIEILHI